MSINFDNTPAGTIILKPASSGNYSLTFPISAGSSGQVLTTDGSGNLSFTTITISGGTAQSAANYTSPWAWDSTGLIQTSITALANALTINADAGTPTDGQKIVFRIKDNGTARALTWTTGSSKSFRAIGVTLPTTTVANKTTYVGGIYNSADSRWDVTAVTTEA